VLGYKDIFSGDTVLSALIERSESELTGQGDSQTVTGAMEYFLMLSARPAESESVVVSVTKETVPTAKCVKYSDGLSFASATRFSFDDSNWDQPQYVGMDIQRKIAYQGASTTRFIHKITSSDPTWQSPFLRPMTIVITDDDECTDFTVGAQKYDDPIEDVDPTSGNIVPHNIRKCRCSEGYYIEESDSNYCESATKCRLCATGMICDGLDRLEDIILETGYYRHNRHSTPDEVLECPRPDACNSTAVGNLAFDDEQLRTHGNVRWKGGSEG
jgi:hypothetical protein